MPPSGRNVQRVARSERRVDELNVGKEWEQLEIGMHDVDARRGTQRIFSRVHFFRLIRGEEAHAFHPDGLAEEVMMRVRVCR